MGAKAKKVKVKELDVTSETIEPQDNMTEAPQKLQPGQPTNHNIKGELLDALVKDFGFEPNFNRIVVTVNRPEIERGGIITTDDALDSVQYVIAAGSRALYKPGDSVMLDFSRISKRVADPNDSTKFIDQLNVIPFSMHGRVFTIITDNDTLGKFK